MTREELERIYNLVTPGRTVAHYKNQPYPEAALTDVKFVVAGVSMSDDKVTLASSVSNYMVCAVSISVSGEFSCTHLTDGDTVIWRRE